MKKHATIADFGNEGAPVEVLVLDLLDPQTGATRQMWEEDGRVHHSPFLDVAGHRTVRPRRKIYRKGKKIK